MRVAKVVGAIFHDERMTELYGEAHIVCNYSQLGNPSTEFKTRRDAIRFVEELFGKDAVLVDTAGDCSCLDIVIIGGENVHD